LYHNSESTAKPPETNSIVETIAYPHRAAVRPRCLSRVSRVANVAGREGDRG